MKHLLLAFSFSLLAVIPAQAQLFGKKGKKKKAKTEEKMDLSNDLNKVSYSLGINIAENLKGQGLDSLNIDAVSKGFADVFEGDSTLMTQEEAGQFLQTYFSQIQEKQAEKMKSVGAKFLEENGKRDEVTTTASGLQYEVLTEGEGAKPSATSTVTVHYHGTLVDGTVFDSSVERGQPATFGLNQVIKGWTEGVQLMSVGSKYRFFIPYTLGYGERGAGGQIGPYATLIFDVELLEIK
tara:strand:- start:136 stop:849 length:714 start_codon:yes stop_codon:yes gene_type:complete